MKRFFRSVAGKCILFLLFTVFAAVFAGGVFAADYMAEENIYAYSEEEYLNDTIRQSVYSGAQYAVYRNLVDREAETLPEGYEAAVIDETGVYLYRSPGYDSSKSFEEFVYPYTILKNGERIYYAQWSVCDPVYFEPYETETTWTESTASYESFENSYNGAETETEAKEEYSESDSVNETCQLIIRADSDKILQENGSELQLLSILYRLRYAVYPIGFLAFVGMICCFVAILCAAGHRPGTEELYRGPLYKVPFDLLTGVLVLLFLAWFFMMEDNNLLNGFGGAVFFGFFVISAVETFLGLSMSCASRVKHGEFISGLLVVKILKLIWRMLKAVFRGVKRAVRSFGRLLRSIPLIWKTALAIGILTAVELLLIIGCRYDIEVFIGFWVVEKIIVIPVVLYAAMMLKKLQKSGEILAKGGLQYKTETKGLFSDFRKHAENLNAISDSMMIAVEDRMKSERMKTELITNVSHDIKTPLTSIINYADLIAKEPCDNETIVNYAEVLGRQSGKLKKLIEDLIEVSKASSGNLEVKPEPCDAGVLIEQAAGEYAEKLENAGLRIVTKIPEEPVMISADSRRMWRIFENLMNNVCKYALGGTRVFLTLVKKDGKAVITLKNTSKDLLDVTGSELTERFVRGDRARSSEGSGLGIPIAKSLCELQGGTFAVETDGDLFKVCMTFPVIIE